MNTKLRAILSLSAALGALGCNHAETEASLPSQPNFADQRKAIEADATMPPAAKQSALQNLDRMESQQKK